MRVGIYILAAFYLTLGICLLVATLISAGPALADDRCPPGTHEVIGPFRCTPQGCSGYIYCVSN